MNEPTHKPITLSTLRRMAAAGERIAVLTCYDATTARWLSRAGLPVLLVGDTAAEMILGEPSTIHVTMDLLIALTRAVKRGAPDCFVMADMPFMSYQACDAEAIRNAGRFLSEAHADAVKLEVDGSFGDLVGKMARAGVPVVAHLGSRPQHVHRTGGYRAAGRSAADANRLVEEAQLMEARGAVMLLLEATTASVAERIVGSVKIPVIGCGAGPACHGHVVVLHDLLGLTDWHPPFVKPNAAIGEAIAQSAKQWIELVQSGKYLKDDHPYR
ncbi:MAG: 3-methyl-2-oxobutanoate hydroxymethyltransferase [Planctomycetes bacterium]|nr:3-methyl-2-oxobutanoate hydroxymethyltransferase [Planctomycetota bacterium]